jgi:hypothetical protein
MAKESPITEVTISSSRELGEIVPGRFFKKRIAMKTMLRGMKSAMTTYVIRHPALLMRCWMEGTPTKIPIPTPEEMMPMANPRFSLNQFCMTVVLGTHPVDPTPMAVIKPKQR